MEAYDTLTEALNALRVQGYKEDFNLQQNCIETKNAPFKLFHDEFVIDKFFRFEDDTNPSDQSVVYAISSVKHNLKGVLVDGYGIYGETLTDEMLEKLKFAGKK